MQFNLFGGTLIGFGTERHEKYIKGVDNLSITGCFCLTELGYGNNAIEMETVAVFNPKDNTFEITTPTIDSQKFWITNGAYYANYAVVFAQTIVNNKNEGINVFVVRLRDEDNHLAKGVTIDDMGCKMGLNGVDNARIILKSVKADKNDLLNKISDIDAEGNFYSSVPGRRQRFLNAANRLLSGRLCIASMMIAGTKETLLITTKYGATRLSNGKTGKSDTPILTYQLFQNQLVPLICRTIVLNLGLKSIRKIYCDYCLSPESFNSESFNNIVRLCCVIKPIVAWNGNEVGNICRERCGGMGFLTINRIESMIYSAHSGMTAEGDSAVLMQKVSKEYVEDYLKKVITINKEEIDTSVNDVFELKRLFNLIKEREFMLLDTLADKTMNNMDNVYKLWMNEESNLIQDLAMIYGERYCIEQAIELLGVDVKIEGKNSILEKILLLTAATIVKKNLSWYLMNKLISMEAGSKLPAQINNLIKEIGSSSLELCESFGIPGHVILAPIYNGYKEYYKADITNGEHYDVTMRPKF